jgi:hypothetical protein
MPDTEEGPLTPVGECEGCGATLYEEWDESGDDTLCTGCWNADDNGDCRCCRRALADCKC